MPWWIIHGLFLFVGMTAIGMWWIQPW
jgi:hypothetical protein